MEVRGLNRPMDEKRKANWSQPFGNQDTASIPTCDMRYRGTFSGSVVAVVPKSTT
jgi:hypothetical protein